MDLRFRVWKACIINHINVFLRLSELHINQENGSSKNQKCERNKLFVCISKDSKDGMFWENWYCEINKFFGAKVMKTKAALVDTTPHKFHRGNED